MNGMKCWLQFAPINARAVLGVNNLLAEVTKMDFIKSMIEDVRKQSQTMNSIAASSEEMAASVDDVANRTQDAAKTADHGVAVATQGVETIAKAFSFCRRGIRGDGCH